MDKGTVKHQGSAKEAAERTAAASFTELAARRRGPLRRYLHDHPVAMDWVVIGVYLVFGLPNAITSQVMFGEWIPLAVLLAGGAVLVFRRRFPVLTLVLMSAGDLVSVLATTTAAGSIGAQIAAYTVAVNRSAKFALAAAVLAGLPMIGVLASFTPPGIAEEVAAGRLPPYIGVISGLILLLFNIIAAGIGITVRRDRRHDAELQRWTEDNARLASAHERNRIAREMHDVVAHSLSVMIALSDGAGVVLKKDPAKAGDVLTELSATGRTALADMRRVLGVLRESNGDQAAPLQPLPDSTSLAALLEGFRKAGLPLRYVITGPPLPQDQSFRLAIYRIVQESLTNVLRYAKGVGTVDVEIERDGRQVRITVSDDGHAALEPPPSMGTGRGIAGMKERAAIYGGNVDCGPGPHGGWTVHAVLEIPGEDK
jgi:signal transduction histidine kinase